MSERKSLPLLWLLSDQRNDAGLENALAALPTGSAFVFRHYHLGEAARRARFDALAAIAREHGHLVILSRASFWGEDGVYGALEHLPADYPGLRFASAHNADEIRAAEQARVDGVFVSPVFPTRSHPGAETLGLMGFHILAQQTRLPVIALGGMTREHAAELGWPRWGAIDGLS